LAIGRAAWVERDDLLGPQGQSASSSSVERRVPLVSISAVIPRVHARAAAADVRALAGGRAEHPVEAVVAVGQLLVRDRRDDRVAHQEHPHLGAVTLGQRRGQAQTVEDPFAALRRVVEDEQNLAAHDGAPLPVGEFAPRVCPGDSISPGEPAAQATMCRRAGA